MILILMIIILSFLFSLVYVLTRADDLEEDIQENPELEENLEFEEYLEFGEDFEEEEERKFDCREFGCSGNVKYVGINGTGKYYFCNCPYLNEMNSTDLICFDNDEIAMRLGYVWDGCN